MLGCRNQQAIEKRYSGFFEDINNWKLQRFCLFYHFSISLHKYLVIVGVQKLNFDFKFGFFPHCLASKVVNSTGCFRPSRLPYNFWSRRNSWWLHVWKNKKNKSTINLCCMLLYIIRLLEFTKYTEKINWK